MISAILMRDFITGEIDVFATGGGAMKGDVGAPRGKLVPDEFVVLENNAFTATDESEIVGHNLVPAYDSASTIDAKPKCGMIDVAISHLDVLAGKLNSGGAPEAFKVLETSIVMGGAMLSTHIINVSSNSHSGYPDITLSGYDMLMRSLCVNTQILNGEVASALDKSR
jgi:hypothetical protein